MTTEPMRPHPVALDVYRRLLNVGVEAGILTLPDGVTVEDVLDRTEWEPIGTMSLLGGSGEAKTMQALRAARLNDGRTPR